ncbi:MAG: hypothetical protein F6J97_23295 [Leptolyngbya sp. SIO4C1]|nr:hypothetical protein [Leptolyngbya sp. SIO4C1]
MRDNKLAPNNHFGPMDILHGESFGRNPADGASLEESLLPMGHHENMSPAEAAAREEAAMRDKLLPGARERVLNAKTTGEARKAAEEFFYDIGKPVSDINYVGPLERAADILSMPDGGFTQVIDSDVPIERDESLHQRLRNKLFGYD